MNSLKKKFNSQLTSYNLTLQDSDLQKLQVYYDLLVEYSQEMNLVGNTDPETVFIEHFGDSFSFNLLNLNDYTIKQDFKHIDLGSGAGFPAFMIKMLYPESFLTCVESVQKKVQFLITLVKDLDLINMEILTERIEILGKNDDYREKFDIVTSRALASMPVLIEYALPFLKSGGIFVAYKTTRETEDLSNLEPVLKLLGGEFQQIINYEIPDKSLGRSLVIIKKTGSTPDKYPRKPGIPKKRPLK